MSGHYQEIDRIGIEDTAVFFPDGILTAREIAELSSIPEEVIIQRFGLMQKHVSDSKVHVSDMAIAAARQITMRYDPKDIDVVIYFGSPHKDYHVWSVAAKIQHEIGAVNAYAFELMNVSSCFPIALKVARDMILADNSIKNVLLVGASKESHIIDYSNPRSRFMFNFGDGGAAALVVRNSTMSRILGSSIRTDGSFWDDVKVPAGGSVHPASFETVEARMHFIDVKDPHSMKERLDRVSISNFVSVVTEAVEKSGFRKDDIRLLLPLHTKRSMFLQLLSKLDLPENQAIYLDHFGHMSALDPCVGLHIARTTNRLRSRDLAVVVSAGTGYTWAATAIEWR